MVLSGGLIALPEYSPNLNLSGGECRSYSSNWTRMSRKESTACTSTVAAAASFFGLVDKRSVAKIGYNYGCRKQQQEQSARNQQQVAQNAGAFFRGLE